VASDTELELIVERLKDEFAELRRKFSAWQQDVTKNLEAIRGERPKVPRPHLSCQVSLVLSLVFAVIGVGIYSRHREPDQSRYYDPGDSSAPAYPSDAPTQRDLSISYDNRGDVQLQSGQVTEALRSYQQGLEIRQKLAAADPTDAQAQFDLYISHHKIAFVHQKQKLYEQAIESYGRGLKVLQALKGQNRLVPANEKWIGILEQAIQQCQHAVTALGDWKTLLEQPAELLPVLLDLRATELVQEGRTAEAVQAVAKLRELGTATAGQLYNAACVYSLCAGRLGAAPSLLAEQIAERQKHIDHALATLREAIAAGWKEFDHMQKDPDIAVLRDLP